MRSGGGVIIYEKRILCSFPTMRCIQTFITHYQDLQDAFAWHAPISRRVRKTRQETNVYKTPKPTRRMRMARSYFKTLSEKHDKTPTLTRRQDLQDVFERHAPFSRHFRKNTIRRQDLQDAFEPHAPFSRRAPKNTTRRQDA